MWGPSSSRDDPGPSAPLPAAAWVVVAIFAFAATGLGGWAAFSASVGTRSSAAPPGLARHVPAVVAGTTIRPGIALIAGSRLVPPRPAGAPRLHAIARPAHMSPIAAAIG